MNLLIYWLLTLGGIQVQYYENMKSDFFFLFPDEIDSLSVLFEPQRGTSQLTKQLTNSCSKLVTVDSSAALHITISGAPC